MHTKKRKPVKHDKSFKAFVDKINKDLNKLESNPKGIFHLSRYFFSNYFHLKHAFTYEELKDEAIKSGLDVVTKNQICEFADGLSEIKYGPEEAKTKRYRELKEMFKDIFLILTESKLEDYEKRAARSSREKAPVKTIFSGVKDVFAMAAKKSIPIEETTPTEELFHEKINEIRYLSEKGEAQGIKAKYAELMTEYSKLSLKNRQKVFHELTRLHSELSGHTNKIDRFYDKLNFIEELIVTKDNEQIKNEYLAAMDTYNQLPSYEKPKAYVKIKELHAKIIS